MTDTKTQSKTLALLALCAAIVAFLSFALPIVSMDFFVTVSYSGFDMFGEAMEKMEFPQLGCPIALLCTVLSVIFAFSAVKEARHGSKTAFFSAGGMLMLFVAMSEENYGIKVIDYADVGFYLYELISLAGVVLSVILVQQNKKDSNTNVQSVHPAPSSVSCNKSICPNCGAEQDDAARFCRFCGTKLVASASHMQSSV